MLGMLKIVNSIFENIDYSTTPKSGSKLLFFTKKDLKKLEFKNATYWHSTVSFL